MPQIGDTDWFSGIRTGGTLAQPYLATTPLTTRTKTSGTLAPQANQVYGILPQYINIPGGVPGNPNYRGLNEPAFGTVGGGVVGVGGGGGGGGTVDLTSFPGYEAIMQDIKGVISPDVKQQMYQSAAERGISMGAPGSPNSDAALMRAIGLTSQQLRQTGVSEMAPLWQQQVSEQGQFARQAADLAASMARLQFSEMSQTERQGMSQAAQMAQLQLQEAGMDARQSMVLAAQMAQLQFSTDAQDRRQAAELQAAMERLKVGNANAMDLEKLQLASQAALTNANNVAAMQRAQLSSSTELGLAGVQNKAAMERLQFSAGANIYESMWNKLLDQWSADQNLKRAQSTADTANAQSVLQVGPNASGSGYGAYVSSLLANPAYGGSIPSYQEYLGTQQAINRAVGAGASFRGGNYYGPSSGYYGGGKGTSTGSQGGAGGATVIVPPPAAGGGYYAPTSWNQHIGTSGMNIYDQAYPIEMAWPEEEDTGERPAPGTTPPWMEE